MQSTLQVTLMSFVESVSLMIHILRDPRRLFLRLVYLHGGFLGFSVVTLVEL